MIIDAHTHIWDKMEDLDILVKAAKLYGIDKIAISSIVGGYYPTQDDIQTSNNQVCECIRRYPDLVLGYCYLNPTYEKESLEELDRRILQDKMHGIKLWVATKCTDPRVEPIAQRAGELNIPILVHTWVKATGNLPDESTPMDMAVLARQFPKTAFIMAHLGGDWEYGIKAIKKNENVYPDISGSISEMDMIESAVSELGAHRIIFGSDMTGSFLTNLGKITGADISDGQREMILWKNAARLLKVQW